ncbi:Hypothetical predicted protein [Scomber scombrus]|uniref:Uncharacterized protein n=1 Tax=Scomber scombrus TaxID=13677 RepID=A0AAV1PW50_SCOSC
MSLPAVEETSTQDPTSTAPPDSSDETEKFASSPEVHETPNQDLEADSPDTSKEPEWSASSPEDPGTPTQDLKAAVAADTSNEPEKSPDYLDMRSTQYAGL